MENASRNRDAVTLTERERKQGNCDICGLWDGALVVGACSRCNDLYFSAGSPAPLVDSRRARC